jgi:hypothetical protein
MKTQLMFLWTDVFIKEFYMAQNTVSKHTQVRSVGYVLFISSLILFGAVFVDNRLADGAMSHLAGLLNYPSIFGGEKWASILDFNQLRPINLSTSKGYVSVKSSPSRPEASPVVIENTTVAPDPKQIEENMLWLARCILSETNRPEEMKLVAWVIRNRYETKYHGMRTYRDVVLEPFQFSAFNPGYSSRNYYSSLKRTSKAFRWKDALNIAADVLNAPVAERPFHLKTRHFYSEISMPGRVQPNWASGRIPVYLNSGNISSDRFRFYRDII